MALTPKLPGGTLIIIDLSANTMTLDDCSWGPGFRNTLRFIHPLPWCIPNIYNHDEFQSFSQILQDGAPPAISCFINPINSFVTSAINHRIHCHISTSYVIFFGRPHLGLGTSDRFSPRCLAVFLPHWQVSSLGTCGNPTIHGFTGRPQGCSGTRIHGMSPWWRLDSSVL